MSESPQLARLKERIELYEETVGSFQRAQDRLIARRKGASDSVMVLIDERLALNQRILDSLTRILAAAKKELKRTRGDSQRVA